MKCRERIARACAHMHTITRVRAHARAPPCAYTHINTHVTHSHTYVGDAGAAGGLLCGPAIFYCLCYYILLDIICVIYDIQNNTFCNKICRYTYAGDGAAAGGLVCAPAVYNLMIKKFMYYITLMLYIACIIGILYLYEYDAYKIQDNVCHNTTYYTQTYAGNAVAASGPLCGPAVYKVILQGLKYFVYTHSRRRRCGCWRSTVRTRSIQLYNYLLYNVQYITHARAQATLRLLADHCADPADADALYHLARPARLKHEDEEEALGRAEKRTVRAEKFTAAHRIPSKARFPLRSFP